MQRLPLTDAAWLTFESRERPLHVAGLTLFRYPADAGPEFMRELAAQMRSHADVRPPFDQRLKRPYGRLGIFHWVQDPQLDLDYHFRHSALPAPGRVRELLALVSRLHSSLMDRHRPLWEAHLIEGLEGDRFALYVKIHHSVMDGVAAMRQVTTSFSADPSERGLPPPWVHQPQKRRDERRASGGTSGDAVVKPLRFGVARTIWRQWRAARRDSAQAFPYRAPKSLLNGRITGSRRFAAQSWALERIRAAGKHYDATINDMVLAMSASALRRYLVSMGELPAKSLIAAVPVSVRPADGSDAGNAITLLLTSLGTHIEDPIERLRWIKRSMDAGKAHMRRLSARQLMRYMVVMNLPMMLGQIFGTAGRGRPMYNVVISNVPGPEEPLYLNGARMEGMYPVSLNWEGQALNITQVSYAGSMEFGLIGCRRTLPSMQRLLDYLEDGLTEVECANG